MLVGVLVGGTVEVVVSLLVVVVVVNDDVVAVELTEDVELIELDIVVVVRDVDVAVVVADAEVELVNVDELVKVDDQLEDSVVDHVDEIVVAVVLQVVVVRDVVVDNVVVVTVVVTVDVDVELVVTDEVVVVTEVEVVIVDDVVIVGSAEAGDPPVIGGRVRYPSAVPRTTNGAGRNGISGENCARTSTYNGYLRSTSVQFCVGVSLVPTQSESSAAGGQSIGWNTFTPPAVAMSPGRSISADTDAVAVDADVVSLFVYESVEPTVEICGSLIVRSTTACRAATNCAYIAASSGFVRFNGRMFISAPCTFCA